MGRWDAPQSWDVEIELQKELDAVSVSSHISSSSSSAGGDEALRTEVADGSVDPLHKLLNDWRAKEKKLESFESMLKGIRTWQNGILYDAHDKVQNTTARQSSAFGSPSLSTSTEDVLPVGQRSEPSTAKARGWRRDSSNTDGERFGCASGPDPTATCDPMDHPREGIDGEAPTEHSLPISRFSQGSDDAESTETDVSSVALENTSNEDDDEGDMPCSSLTVHEDALNMLEKKRMRILDEYRDVEVQRLAGRNLKRQAETEESTKTMLLATEKQQELEEKIRNEKLEKLAFLDREQELQKQLFEELQRTEECDLETQKQEMEQNYQALMVLADTYKHIEEELELKRSEQNKTTDSSVDQEQKCTTSVKLKPGGHCITSCILIQARIRGFLARRRFLTLKLQDRQTNVTQDEKSHEQVVLNGQQCPSWVVPEEVGLTAIPKDHVKDFLGQNYPVCLAPEDMVSTREGGENICRHGGFLEEDMIRARGLAESGDVDNVQTGYDLPMTLGLDDETSYAVDELNQRKERVQTWLEQVMQGWDVKKSKIQEEILEARRLELVPIYTMAEAFLVAREKQIRDNLEASILKASRRNYNHWMHKAKIFGVEEITLTYSKCFQRKMMTVGNNIKREAKLGTKEGYSVLFNNAASLGLQSDERLALKILFKRMIQLFRRAIVLAGTSRSENDPTVQDWKTVEMEALEIGIRSQTLTELKQTICESRSLDFSRKICMTTLKTNDAGTPIKILHELYRFVNLEKATCHAAVVVNTSNLGVPLGSSEEISTSTLAIVPERKSARSVPQNWEEMNRLQRLWQQHAVGVQSVENNCCSSVSQHGRDNFSPHEKKLSGRFAGHKIIESSLSSSCHIIAQQCASEREDTRERQRFFLESSKDHRHKDEEASCVFSEDGNDVKQCCQTQVSKMVEVKHVNPQKNSLTIAMLGEKLNCNRRELRWVMKVDLTDEHLKSLGKAELFHWCPRLRSLTVDMNKLSTLSEAFQGGEDTLEYLSARDNCLEDMAGLECLCKLAVLHLDGNSLSQLALGLPLSTEVQGNKNVQKLEGPYRASPGLEFCWSRLQVLTAGRNQLTSVLTLGSLCPNLEILDLGSNLIATLGDAEGNALVGLHHLRVLDVGQNRLRDGSLWKGLEYCPKLVSLVASRNKLRELPSHIGSALLREIWLNGNAIKKLACKAWLPSLQRLYLQDNIIDTLESLWGCPSLEVLDLSFNNISELFHLQHLSCFPCLRSLQLNDNPISEQQEHTDFVLQAVPWIAELDNEAVAKASRDKAVRMIFKRIIDVVGLDFLREKLSRGEALVHGCYIPCSALNTPRNNRETARSRGGQFIPVQNVNDIFNGNADEVTLWRILLEVKNLATSSPIIRSLLSSNMNLLNFEGLCNFLQSELEARNNMIAYQQMTAGLKGRLHAATKERCSLKSSRGHNLTSHHDQWQASDNRPLVPFLRLAPDVPFSSDQAGGSDLEWCLDQHKNFDSNTFREVYSENTQYKMQMQAHVKRVTRLQALVRGFLARSRLLRERQMALQQATLSRELKDKYARKIQTMWRSWKVRQIKEFNSCQGMLYSAAVAIQAHWKGYSTRVRLQRALDMSKYVDDDEFEYTAIDNSEFLAREITLSPICEPRERTLPRALDKRVITSKSPRIVPASLKRFQAPIIDNDEGKNSTVGMMHGVAHVCQMTSPFDFGIQCAEQREATPCGAEIRKMTHLTEFHNNLTKETDSPIFEGRMYTCEPAIDRLAEIEELKTEERRGNDEDVTVLFDMGLKSNFATVTEDAVARAMSGSDADGPQNVDVQLRGLVQSIPSLNDHIVVDERNDSPVPSVESKKRATVEEIAKDWGFKSASTVQALLKARGRRKQQAKDAAHTSLLQDPDQRLRRFREKLEGCPQVVYPVRKTEQRPYITFSDHGQDFSPHIATTTHANPDPGKHLDKSTTHEMGCTRAPPLNITQKKKSAATTPSARVAQDFHENREKDSLKCRARDLSPMHFTTIVLDPTV